MTPFPDRRWTSDQAYEIPCVPSRGAALAAWQATLLPGESCQMTRHSGPNGLCGAPECSIVCGRLTLPTSRSTEGSLTVLEADLIQLIDDLMCELVSHPASVLHVD